MLLAYSSVYRKLCSRLLSVLLRHSFSTPRPCRRQPAPSLLAHWWNLPYKHYNNCHQPNNVKLCACTPQHDGCTSMVDTQICCCECVEPCFRFIGGLVEVCGTMAEFVYNANLGEQMHCIEMHKCSTQHKELAYQQHYNSNAYLLVIRHLLSFVWFCVQSRYRRIRQWQVMYAVQAFGDKWRSLERRKDRQRQAFEAAISNASGLDLQSNLQEAADQVDQATSVEVRCATYFTYFK